MFSRYIAQQFQGQKLLILTKTKLKLLIESKETRQKFGENARRRVKENFDIEIVTDRVIKIYQDEMNKISQSNG